MVTSLVLAASLVLAPWARAERTHLKPGWNVFSAQQDVELGRQVSKDAERKVPMLNDSKVDAYLNGLGRRLAAHAPGERFPYQYKCVNDRAINAFALPGGFVYINRGVIEAADNEAQLAGVMAHETAHVSLRHGTNQATKAYATQLPLAVLGGMLGSGSMGAILTQLGAGFAVNSLLLKYSRTDESQADILGTQILYDSGYDPRAMAQFFEKIEAEHKGKNPPEFFSSHPNPEHRVERVSEEVDKLGGAPPNYIKDSAEFREIKRHVLALPVPPKAGRAPQGTGSRSRRPDPPASRLQKFQNDMLQMGYPENWRANSQSSALSFVPDGGVFNDGHGNPALAYGMIINVFEPHSDREQISVEEATDQLVDDMRRSNPNMRVVRRHERIRLDGQQGLSTYLSNASPAGGRETDWLITVLRPEGLVYFVGVAPEGEYDQYERAAFEPMLNSVRFRR